MILELRLSALLSLLAFEDAFFPRARPLRGDCDDRQARNSSFEGGPSGKAATIRSAQALASPSRCERSGGHGPA